MRNHDTPLFITFEGGEGSGKSTQSKKLYQFLLSQNIKVIHTREVGGTQVAEQIREILVHTTLYSVTELMLVMAARYEHINKIIIPALRDGCWVICDRYIDSTACYQSSKFGLTSREIYDLHQKFMAIKSHQDNDSKDDLRIMPNITFFMDIPPNTGLMRAATRNENNKFENLNISFHQQIYDQFKLIANLFKDRIVQITCCDLSVDQIHQRIVEHIIYRTSNSNITINDIFVDKNVPKL